MKHPLSRLSFANVIAVAVTALAIAAVAGVPGAASADAASHWLPTQTVALGGPVRPSLGPLLIKRGEVPGFDPASALFVPDDLRSWVDHLRYKGPEREEVEARLAAEKWVTGADRRLVATGGSKGEGTQILEEFEGAAGARAEMAAQLKADLAPSNRRKGERVRFFRIPGLARAKAFEFVEKGHVWAANALFVEGPVLVLVGAFEPAGHSRAAVSAGVEAIVKNTKGSTASNT
jgi:hypothetical protein